VGLALVRSFGTASATPLCLRRWIVPLLLDHIDIASVLHNKSAPRRHLCDRTAFLFVIGFWLHRLAKAAPQIPCDVLLVTSPREGCEVL